MSLFRSDYYLQPDCRILLEHIDWDDLCQDLDGLSGDEGKVTEKILYHLGEEIDYPKSYPSMVIIVWLHGAFHISFIYPSDMEAMTTTSLKTTTRRVMDFSKDSIKDKDKDKTNAKRRGKKEVLEIEAEFEAEEADSAAAGVAAVFSDPSRMDAEATADGLAVDGEGRAGKEFEWPWVMG